MKVTGDRNNVIVRPHRDCSVSELISRPMLLRQQLRRAVGLHGKVQAVSASRLGPRPCVRAVSSLGGTDQLLQHVKDPSNVKTSCYIGGKWVGAEDGSTIKVRATLLKGSCFSKQQWVACQSATLC
jgi:hypothetical protein